MTADDPTKMPTNSSLFKRIWQTRKALLVTCVSVVGAAITYMTTYWGPLEATTAAVTGYYEKHTYLNTRRPPYPSLLDKTEVGTWNSGRAQLAIFQIQGYLGQLKTAPGWIKQCLTDKSIFPNDYETQLNDRYEMAPPSTEQRNLATLQHQIDAADLQSDPLLRTTDVFTRLLDRSRTTLLYRYHDNEIVKLEEPELYLLRNAIYERHGRPFDTAKLEKYANRHGWPSSDLFAPADVSPIEGCNALYLAELHGTREPGALGRGVLVRNVHLGPVGDLLKASLCSCLGQPKVLVECRENSGGSNEDEFRGYVDLILEFDVADKNSVAWTFLDPRSVASADLADFKSHTDSFLASAVNFSAGVQSVLKPRNFAFGAAGNTGGAYWGARLTLTQEVIDGLNSDPTFLTEFSSAMCKKLHEALEMGGQYVPRVIRPASVVSITPDVALTIVNKPIVFDDLRIKLTLEYLQKHSGKVVTDISFQPRMIILHDTNFDTLDASYEAVRASTVSQSDISGSGLGKQALNSSMHYLVDKDGKIYSLMQDFYVARHAVGLDQIAIGIGNVGVAGAPVTEAQANADALLIRFLKRKYDNIIWLIGASEAANFKGTQLWEETDVRYGEPVFDPGRPFMDRLRTELDELHLRKVP